MPKLIRLWLNEVPGNDSPTLMAHFDNDRRYAVQVDSPQTVENVARALVSLANVIARDPLLVGLTARGRGSVDGRR